MIRYNKRITIKQTNYGLKLESDRGETYELTPITASNNKTPITSWWEKQGQSQLRRDQMDCIIKEYWRQYSPLDLFLIFKRGEGYSQTHDIMLAFDPERKLWILSTHEHTWFNRGLIFNVDEAMGSVSNPDDRLEIYKVIDNLEEEKQYYVSKA